MNGDGTIEDWRWIRTLEASQLKGTEEEFVVAGLMYIHTCHNTFQLL